MLASYSSTGLAEGLKEKIIKKTLKVIGKRELLYKNMDKYTLKDSSKIIGQITDQQSFSVIPSVIPQSHDFNQIMFDNMCSISDKRVNEQTQKEQASERYTNLSRASSQRKKTANNIKRQFSATRQIGNSYLSHTGLQYIATKKDKINQEEPHIDNLRQLKKKQQQEEKAKRNAQQIIRKKAALINLNNERVMFGYEGNVMKLEKAKQIKNQSISYLRTNIQENQDEELQSNNPNVVNKYINTPINITKKINITEREAQEEIQHQKRHKKSISLRQKKVQPVSSTQSTIIKINPQSHKEVQQAVSINQQGVKLMMNSKNFFLQKNYKTLQPNQPSRRMTRSQYLQIKSREQMSKFIRRPKAQFLSEDSQLSIGQLKNQSKIIAQKHAKKYKMSIKQYIGDSKSDRQKVIIHSAYGKLELLKATTQTFIQNPIIDNPKPIGNNSLSKVDKYNLLYLKYKGNPPYASFQTFNTRHQTEGSELKSHKPSFMSIFSQKKTTIRNQIRQKCKTEYE